MYGIIINSNLPGDDIIKWNLCCRKYKNITQMEHISYLLALIKWIVQYLILFFV